MTRQLSVAFQHAHTIRQLLTLPAQGNAVQVNGWVKSLRLQKRIGFAMISDGTCAQNLQVVFPDPTLPRKSVSGTLGIQKERLMSIRLSNGASVRLTGKLAESPGRGQDRELVATSLEVLGDCDPEVHLHTGGVFFHGLKLNDEGVSNTKASAYHGVSARTRASSFPSRRSCSGPAFTRYCHARNPEILRGRLEFYV